MFQTHTIDLGETLIHYAEAPAPGAPLVLIHGITGALDSFAPVIPPLAQQSHVYAFDLRGHNLSGRTPGAYQIADYGRDAAAFLQQVVGRPAVVAGHSLGGVIAIWLAAHAPEWVRGVFLEDPPLYIMQTPRLQETFFYGYFVFLRAALLEHHARGGTLDEMIAFVGQTPANDKQTMLEAVGAEAVRRRAVELQRMDPAVLAPAIAGAMLGAYEPDDLLAQVRCPLHLLAAQAALGGAMTAADVQRFANHAAHGTQAVIEAGHGIHEERPAEYVQAVQQFVAQVGVESY
ncbi:MAG: alpha/beta hydrolase [Burkholderiaceae bacterium]|nr:alpha/beta hydrolase [Burkholderiaceae bacterium]